MVELLNKCSHSSLIPAFRRDVWRTYDVPGPWWAMGLQCDRLSTCCRFARSADSGQCQWPGMGPVLGSEWSSEPVCLRRPAGGIHQPHLRVLAGHEAPGPGRCRVRPSHCHQHLLSRPAQRAGAQPSRGPAAALRGCAVVLHPHQEATGTGAQTLPRKSRPV